MCISPTPTNAIRTGMIRLSLSIADAPIIRPIKPIDSMIVAFMFHPFPSIHLTKTLFEPFGVVVIFM